MADDETTEQQQDDERKPGEGPAGIRPGGDATVADRGDVDPDAVRDAMRKLDQAGGGH